MEASLVCCIEPEKACDCVLETNMSIKTEVQSSLFSLRNEADIK